jgi:outer membrane protein TolC
MLRHRRSAAAIQFGIALLLAGCASFSPDAGMNGVTAIVAEANKIDSEEAAAAANARTRKLLGSPLSADTAVRLALLNNNALQASYNELGIAEAAKIEASLPPNPTFLVRGTSTPVELDIEREIAGDVLALATLPARSSIAADRFHQAQLKAANDTLQLAAETRANFYRAVASRQLVGFLRQAVAAAETAAKLAKELGETGAINKLDVAREQTFHIELAAQLTAAQRQAASAREDLVRSLGLSGDDGLKLPAALPALPKRPKTIPAVEVEAVRRRIDVESRASKLTLWRNLTDSRVRRASSICWTSPAFPARRTRREATAAPAAAARSNSRCRFSTSVRSGCAKRRRPIARH